MKKFLILFTVLILTGFLVCQAQAGLILKADPTGINNLLPFSVYPSTASSYKTALEIYNPNITATSSNKGIVALQFDVTEIFGGTVTAPVTVTFRFTDGDASFAIAGPNYVWVLTNDPTLAAANRDVYAASSAGAVGPTITLTSGNVNCASNASGSCDIPSNKPLYLVQASWSDGGALLNVAGKIDVGLHGTSNELSSPTSVSANLINKKADCNTHPVWPLSASISGTSGNIQFPVVSFTYVTPQISVTNPASGSLNAELNSDTDFKTFVLGSGSGPNVTAAITINDNPAAGSGFYVVTDLASTEPWNWIAWTTGANCSLSFDLQSVNPEPGVSSITFNTNACTANSTKTQWQCSSGLFAPTTDLDLVLTLDGTTSNNPTIWSVNNLTVTGILCYDSNPRTVGAWFGGVEALVPFVKSDPAVGAQTYVIFYNRSDVDVPVYAKALINDASPILISVNPIDTIPAHSKKQYTADQLKSKLPELANYDMKQGVPIKFMFRVPSQSGTIPYIVVGNPLDPYIEGIVVSVYGSEQRSVPLKFKVFKQGNYNE